MGNRHHFVPRFYLTAFSCAPRRINLFNLQRSQVIFNASLRDQCYAHRLYGADDTVEGAFAKLEDISAAIFCSIRERRVLPGGGTSDRDILLKFIGLQLERTTAAQASTMDFSRLLVDVAFRGVPPEGFDMSPSGAMRLTLNAGLMAAKSLNDLSATLILPCHGTSFVTSDNPVFKYNGYCEGITDSGVTGARSRGLQIFFPVSPDALLYLFDPGVYKLERERSRARLISATQGDMNALNRMQAVSALENVYFASPELGPEILESAGTVQLARKGMRPRMTVAVDTEDAHSELLHQYTPMPQLGVELSFASIRSNAMRVPLFVRARQMRGPYRTKNRNQRPSSESRVFAVKSHHRA